MEWNYFNHLMFWTMPVIIGQWFLGGKIFLANWRAIVFPALIVGTYLNLIDTIAVREGIWFFDVKQILGIYIGPLPIEEVLFFYVTAWLVAQSVVLFLPDSWRHPSGQ